MASCVSCGKPIGLLEYTWGDSKKLGLCRSCRNREKWCDDCEYMFRVNGDSSQGLRCLKRGCDLSSPRDWRMATNCQDYKPKVVDRKSMPNKDDKRKPSNGSGKKREPKRRLFLG